MTTGTERTQLQVWQERFEALAEHYDADGPDATTPFAARDGRFAVVTEREGVRFINRAATRQDAERLAGECLSDIEGPVALHDLDLLDGERPPLGEGDVVRYAPGDVAYAYRVERVDEELIEGEIARYLILLEVGGELEAHPNRDWDQYDHRVHQDDVDVIESAEPDERLAVCYRVARVQRIVVFNTVAS